MCGRYAVTTDPAKLAAEIDAVNEVPADLDGPPATPSYNVAPTTTVMTVVKRHATDNAGKGDPDDEATLRIRAMRWGLVPPWTKEIGKGPLLFNARAETAAEKSSFRAAVKSKRCLVPMDGWYEWKKGPAGSNGKPTKIPFFMSPHDGTRLFMAGLWSVWHPKDGDADASPLLSCTILTTDAVGHLQDVHDRMPLIMPFGQWDKWLDPDHTAPDGLFAPPSAAIADAIDIREVAPLVNRVSNNSPELLEPVS